ncbi:beta-N-acetylglucosaminidase domain-containing protein [Jiangella anatolica]|nr:beta-N-acetylglucosaminidase domain-containing protein [Jiangella anatolica]
MLTPVPRELVTTGGDGVRVGSVAVSADDRCATAAAVLAGLPTAPGGSPVSVVVGLEPGGPAEGYRLVVSGSEVTITGSDPAGAFYGAQTLLGLAADGVLPPVTVADWPQLRWRGTIEGFYGPPWSHADRLAHLEFAGRHKLNTYVYAPKDDPYHRRQWRDPYPAAELDRIGELAAAARRSHVRFVFSVSPGLSMVYSDPAEVDLLVAKLAQVRDAGVEDVALLFDDIPADLPHSADRAAFGAAPGSSARAHAAVCRAVIDRLGLDRPLIMVPTDYAGTSATPHRELLAAELPADVLVWWTGRDIVVGDITRAEIDAAARSYGHELLLWDNFPVNDFDFPRLFLGPLLGRTTELAGAPLAGITANPMPHEAASRIAVATVAEWAWNPASYDADAAHERALSAVGASAAVRTLAGACASWPPSAPQDPQLSALTEAALGGSPAAVEELRDRFTAMVAAAPADDRMPRDDTAPDYNAAVPEHADTPHAGAVPAVDLRERRVSVPAHRVGSLPTGAGSTYQQPATDDAAPQGKPRPDSAAPQDGNGTSLDGPTPQDATAPDGDHMPLHGTAPGGDRAPAVDLHERRVSVPAHRVGSLPTGAGSTYQQPSTPTTAAAAESADERQRQEADAAARLAHAEQQPADAAAPVDERRRSAARMEREVGPWLVALADTGRAGLAALAALSPSAGERERRAAAEALAVAEAHEQHNVLRDVVPPFVQAVLAR